MSGHLRQRFADDPSMRLCHEGGYQAVYQLNSRFLQPARLALHRRSPLRTGRDHRRFNNPYSPSTTGPPRPRPV
jgi:IS30 family transposase